MCFIFIVFLYEVCEVVIWCVSCLCVDSVLFIFESVVYSVLWKLVVVI